MIFDFFLNKFVYFTNTFILLRPDHPHDLCARGRRWHTRETFVAMNILWDLDGVGCQNMFVK